MDFLNNILHNISINSLTTVIDVTKNTQFIELFFYLDDYFDLNKFSASIEKFNIKYNIPIKMIKQYEEFIFLNFEIYICINAKMMAIICSHKYYDARSIYKILELIDGEYKNVNTNEVINLDNIFLINNFEYGSIINYLFREKKFIDFKMRDQLVLFKHTTNTKSLEIINEIQDLFAPLDILLIIDKRKELNIPENTISCYTDLYYIKNHEKDFINKIKNVKNNFSIFDNNFILCNSYLKFKLPSFCIEQVPIDINLHEIKFFYYIFITPKNKEGNSSIFMNKNLYNLLQ